MKKFLISYEQPDGFVGLKTIEAESSAEAIFDFLAGGIDGWENPGIRHITITGITEVVSGGKHGEDHEKEPVTEAACCL